MNRELTEDRHQLTVTLTEILRQDCVCYLTKLKLPNH